MVLVELPDPWPLPCFSLALLRCRLAGSFIGGVREMQEMFDFCAPSLHPFDTKGRLD